MSLLPLIFCLLPTLLFTQRLQYTIFNDIENYIRIPQEIYYNEEPFRVDFNTFISTPIGISNDRSISRVNNFCRLDPLITEVYEAAVFKNQNIMNPEFLNIDNYIYFIDTRGILQIFSIATTNIDPDPKYRLEKLNELKLNVKITDNSTVRFFGDSVNKRIYLIIDDAFHILSIVFDYKSPLVVSIQKLDFDGEVRQVINEGKCFYYLSGFYSLDMFCLDEIDKLSKYPAFADDLMSTKVKIVLSISQIHIDNSILYIAEKNNGVFAIDMRNYKQPKLLFYKELPNVVKLKKYLQSLFVVVQGENGTFFQEYFCYMNPDEPKAVEVTLNRNLPLQSSIPDMHLVRNYILLKDANLIKTYRHSIDSDYFLEFSITLFEGVLQLHRLETTKYNMFIAIFPNRISIYSIETKELSLKCNPTRALNPMANYVLNFSVYSTTCKEKTETLLNYSKFVSCLYHFEATTDVLNHANNGGDDSQQQKGLIAGLTVGLFFAVVIVITLFCILYKECKKNDKFKKMQNEPLPVLALEMESNEEKHSEASPKKEKKGGETIMTPEHNRV